MVPAPVLLPVAAAALVAAALAWPAALARLEPGIVPLLSVVMFGMGTTLGAADFAAVARAPGRWLLGLGLQFLVMPLLAFVLALALGLPDALLAGMVLVGSCPGGTASNVICYLARGNVALSVSLTSASTLAAVVLTPWLSFLYLGERVAVPAGAMMGTLLMVIVLPVAGGLAAARLLGRRMAGLQRVFPAVSMLAIALIVAIIVALNREALHTLAGATVAAVIAHNAAGLGVGYLAARLLAVPEREARTIAVEVGMQNSGLAVALALKHFSAAAALPGAVFSVWHNLSGLALAALWRRRAPG